MADANRDTVINELRRYLKQVTTRKGPYSIIAQTLAAALRSGNDRDLSAGLFAYSHFDKSYEELTLGESLRRVEDDGKERAERRRALWESRLPDGAEFTHPLSTAGRRHLLAKAPRAKRRVVLKRKPRS
jgi:hypothetical protein